MSYSDDLAKRWFLMLTKHCDEFHEQSRQAISEIIKLYQENNSGLFNKTVNSLMILLVRHNYYSVYNNLLNNGINDIKYNGVKSAEVAFELGRLQFVKAIQLRIVNELDQVFNRYYINAIENLNIEMIFNLLKLSILEVNFVAISKHLKQKKVEIFAEYMMDFDREKYFSDLIKLKNITSVIILKHFINISDNNLLSMADVLFSAEYLNELRNTHNIHYTRTSIRAQSAVMFCKNYLLDYIDSKKEMYKDKKSFINSTILDFGLYFDFVMIDNLVNLLIKLTSDRQYETNLNLELVYREYVNQKYSSLISK